MKRGKKVLTNSHLKCETSALTAAIKTNAKNAKNFYEQKKAHWSDYKSTLEQRQLNGSTIF